MVWYGMVIDVGVMDVGVEQTFSPPNFSMFLLEWWIIFGLQRAKMLG